MAPDMPVKVNILWSCAFVVFAANATDAPVTYEVSVGRTPMVSLSEAEADAIVEAIAKGPYLPPNVVLKRVGPVDSCPGVSLVKNRDQRDGLFPTALPKTRGRICVVEGLDWCGDKPPTPPIKGCSDIPGWRIVVVRYGYLEPLLWAHEFSHSRGNDHRFDADALMIPDICGNCSALNEDEVTRLRAAQAFALAKLAPPRTRPFSRDVLLRAHVHGMPLGTFLQITASHEQEIRSVLEDRGLRLFHENALIALAFLPKGKAFDDLRNYVERTADVDATARRNRRAAVLAQGYLLALQSHDEAMSFLKRLTDPTSILRRDPPWIRGDEAAEVRQLRVRFEADSLASSAVTALGLSGRKEAAEHLKELEQRGRREGGFAATMLPAIEQAMKINASVQQGGIKALGLD